MTLPFVLPTGSLLLERETGALQVVVDHLVIPGEPQSKNRARHHSKSAPGGTAGAIAAAEHAFAEYVTKRLPEGFPTPHQSFGVMAAFHCGNWQKRDVDNMLKFAIDAMTHVVWSDDCQVTEVAGRLLRGAAPPRSEILVYATENQTPPTKHCETCGRRFTWYRSSAGGEQRRFCGTTCTQAYREETSWRTCEECGKRFMRKPTVFDRGQTMCSASCRKQNALKNLVKLTCEWCGREFTMRPSELKYQPNRRHCTATCRNKTRAKNATGARQRPGFARPAEEAS